MNIPEAISIIITYHSGPSFLKACLESLLKSVRPEDEIIVIVNNADQNAHSVNAHSDRVKYYHFYENLGYAKAVNIGVEKSCNEFIVIADHDLVFEDKWLECLWAFFTSHADLGAVSCKIINTLTNKVLDYGIAFSEFNFGHPFMDLPRDHALTDVDRITQMICAGGLLMKKEIFKGIGGFDETFGSLYTDLDICLQLKKRNLRVGVASGAVAYHFAGEFAQEAKQYKASYLKSDVKGAFMRKNAETLEVDMGSYYKISAEYIQAQYGVFKNYFFCNMLNVANPGWYEKEAISLNIVRSDGILRPTGKRDAENTRLFESLGYDIMLLGIPVAYFVDRYISVKDNSFWWQNRRGYKSDIVLDRNGNIVPLVELI